MSRRALLSGIALFVAVLALVFLARGGSSGARLWRARLASVAVDRDGDVRNNLLAEGGDPFALRRRLLAASTSAADATTWHDFTAAAAAPRPDYEAIDRTVAALEPDRLPRGAADAYRYLQLWSFWQRNRPGSAAATLEALAGAGREVLEGAGSLAREAGTDGAVQLVVPGPVRAAGAAGGGPHYRLRRLLPLATRRLAISWSVPQESAPAVRTELVVLSVGDVEFIQLALLPDGAFEIVTPSATVRGPSPTSAGSSGRVRLVWDAAAEEAILTTADGVELRAPGASAPLEPPTEIELSLPGIAVLRDVVVAAAPRGASTI